jgi:hypothetical protein
MTETIIPAAERSSTPRKRNLTTPLILVGVLLIQIALTVSFWSTSQTVQRLEDQNADLQAVVEQLTDDLAGIRTSVAAQTTPGSISASPDSALQSTTILALPRLPEAGADPALGLVLPEIKGIEYYTNTEQPGSKPIRPATTTWRSFRSPPR